MQHLSSNQIFLPSLEDIVFISIHSIQSNSPWTCLDESVWWEHDDDRVFVHFPSRSME